MSRVPKVSIGEIIKRLVKKNLLEEDPVSYCYEDEYGNLRMNIRSEKCNITIHSVLIYDEIVEKSFLRTFVRRVKTDQYVAHVHVYQKTNSANSYYNPFNGTDALEIVSWMKKNKRRHSEFNIDKQIKFLESL